MSLKKKTPEQYAIISKYFELKDQVNNCDIYFNSIQNDFNVTIIPRPQIFTEVDTYFKETEFIKISNLEKPEDVSVENEKLQIFINNLESFSLKLEKLKLKLQKYYKQKQGFENDEQVNELKNMLKEIQKDENISQSNSVDSEENYSITEQVVYCDDKIDENTGFLLDMLKSKENELFQNTQKEIDMDLMILKENKDDDKFLQEAEINDQKIEVLGEKLNQLKKQKDQIKKKIKIFEQTHLIQLKSDKNNEKKNLRQKSLELKKINRSQWLLENNSQIKRQKVFLNELKGERILQLELVKENNKWQKKELIQALLNQIPQNSENQQLSYQKMLKEIQNIKDKDVSEKLQFHIQQMEIYEKNQSKVEEKQKELERKFTTKLQLISDKVRNLQLAVNDDF